MLISVLRVSSMAISVRAAGIAISTRITTGITVQMISALVLWSMVVLYVTLGFRQFSHHFTDIRVALEAGDEVLARQLFADWHQVDAMDLPRSEMVRHVIEHALIAAHRHVFGVLAWFSVGAALGLGPAGAVLYRMSQYAMAVKPQKTGNPTDVLQGVSEALAKKDR